MRKATIGRIVHHRIGDGEPDINGGRIMPAVIVRVWNDNMVNLKVLTDDEHDRWVTSVRLDEADTGVGMTSWWPPQVG